jgi:hypothetical protein
VPLYQILNFLYPNSPRTNRTIAMVYSLCYVAWFGTFVASRHYPGLNGLMGVSLIAIASILGMVRSSFRVRYNLRSSLLADCLGCLFFWPQVLAQLRVQMCCAGELSVVLPDTVGKASLRDVRSVASSNSSSARSRRNGRKAQHDSDPGGTGTNVSSDDSGCTIPNMSALKPESTSIRLDL